MFIIFLHVIRDDIFHFLKTSIHYTLHNWFYTIFSELPLNVNLNTLVRNTVNIDVVIL